MNTVCERRMNAGLVVVVWGQRTGQAPAAAAVADEGAVVAVVELARVVLNWKHWAQLVGECGLWTVC